MCCQMHLVNPLALLGVFLYKEPIAEGKWCGLKSNISSYKPLQILIAVGLTKHHRSA